MTAIHARDLLTMTEDQVWSLQPGYYTVTTDEGNTHTVLSRQLICTWYFLPLHRKYPKMRIMDHHVFTDKFFNKSKNIELYTAAVYELFLQYGDLPERESIWEIVTVENNNFYNAVVERCREYITSANILDFIAISQHPRIVEGNRVAKERMSKGIGNSQDTIDELYKIIADVVFNCPTLDDVSIVKAIRIGLTGIDQPNQIVGPRGFMTDADSNIFTIPIWNGFLEGLTQFVDVLKESCSAKKALTFNKHPLRMVEWFNRKMQLICQNVQGLVRGSCGHHRTLAIKIVSEKQLRGMVGKFYKQEDGSLGLIHKNAHDLVGTTLNVYSPLTCGYRHTNHVCYRCFGLNSISVPSDANLGQVSSTELCEPGSQLVLSVKHYDGSSTVSEISLQGYEAEFMRIGTKTGTLHFRDKLKGKRAKLILAVNPNDGSQGAMGLNSLQSDQLISNISIQRITSFRTITLRIPTATGYIDHKLSTAVGKRIGSLSRELLAYIREHRWSITDDGDYEIDLEHWDYHDVAIVLPLKHVNMLDVMTGIENFIRSVVSSGRTEESSLDRGDVLASYLDPAEAIQDMYQLVSDRLDRVNWAHLEVIALAYMCPRDRPHDYNIPHIDEASEFRPYDDIIINRSQSQTFAYQFHDKIVSDPLSFVHTRRNNHPLDPVLLPY